MVWRPVQAGPFVPRTDFPWPPYCLESLRKGRVRLQGQTRQTMTKHGTILLVEDNANDIVVIRKAFAEAGVHNPLQTVHSGEEAVKYLGGQGKFADREKFPLPFLALLDLKMSHEDGFAVLRWLYERPGLKKKFTLIVLGSDSSDSEVQLAYELGA